MMEEPKKEKLLLPLEVADRLRVSTDSVYRWVRQKRLNAVFTPGGQIRIPAEELEKFCNKSQQMHTDATDSVA